jgi:hypothetical protein
MSEDTMTTDQIAQLASAHCRSQDEYGKPVWYLDDVMALANELLSASKPAVFTVPERLPGEAFGEWAKRTYEAQDPAAPAQLRDAQDERADALCDSSYCAGLQQGFTFGQQDDNEGLHKALAARDGYVKVLREARALLSASKPAAQDFEYRHAGWWDISGGFAVIQKDDPAPGKCVPLYTRLSVAPASPAQSGEPVDTYPGDNLKVIQKALHCNQHGDTESVENWLTLLCDRLAAPQPAQTERALTAHMINQAWRDSGTVSASPPDWALAFAQNIARALTAAQPASGDKQ